MNSDNTFELLHTVSFNVLHVNLRYQVIILKKIIFVYYIVQTHFRMPSHCEKDLYHFEEQSYCFWFLIIFDWEVFRDAK